MSTRIGVIAEGPIDHAIIGPILTQIAGDRAAISWPVLPEDVAELIQLRKRGHGGVLKALEKVFKVLREGQELHYSFIVILLDRRTERIQRAVRRQIGGNSLFVLGICKEEIEAWWLGDRTNTLAWLGLPDAPSGGRYASAGYRSERDREPKKTLDELTRESTECDQCYGQGSVELARDFAELWQGRVRLNEIENHCPEKFPPFSKDIEQAFRAVVRASGRLF